MARAATSDAAVGRAETDRPPDPDRRYAGKTLGERRDEQRERILLAGRDVFAERGYAGAGIDEIVAKARVSRTTFYAFFENKEECLLAVFALGVHQLGTALVKAVMATSSPAHEPMDRIRAEVRALAATYAADPAMARIVLIGVVGATPACEQARVEARDQAARVIQAQLEEYEYWLQRPPLHRRVASLAAMAAIAEPMSELVVQNRLPEWETLVEPISQAVGHGIISPQGFNERAP